MAPAGKLFCSLESAMRRIGMGAGLLQSFTAEKLVDEGFSRKTFRLHTDSDGIPKCVLFRTRLKTAAIYGMVDTELWKFLRMELRNTFPEIHEKCKFLAFVADTRYAVPESDAVPELYEDMLLYTKGHVVLGGSCKCLVSGTIDHVRL